MRVLYLHQHFSTPEGAAGTRSYELARRMVARGHAVTVVCGRYDRARTGLDGPFRRGRRSGTVDGIRVVEIDLPYSNSDGFFRRAASFARFALGATRLALTEPCDVVVATSTPLTVALPGMLARWLRRVPFVFEVRDLWPELPRAMGVVTNKLLLGALSALEWAAYRSADRLVALSPGIVEGIARRGVGRGRIAMVPNGCDLALFAGSEVSGWRPAGVGPDALMAVFAGTHGLANGLDAVLDAAAVLKARGRADIRLVLVGDGGQKPRLVARARAEGLEAVVFNDSVAKTRLAGLLRGADLGLQCLADVPAFYDGTSPNKVFDYLAAGLPVLINYPGWLAELIEERRCGVAVPPGDAAAMADALEAAAADREALRAMGANAALLARERFDRDALGDAWIDWVVGAAGGPPRA